MDIFTYKIHRLAEFDNWLKVQTPSDIALVQKRIHNMQRGTFGDCKPIGRGIAEARIHEGPGLRFYYLVRGETIILLMHGGTKRTQQADIKKAHQVLDRLIERQKKIAADQLRQTPEKNDGA